MFLDNQSCRDKWIESVVQNLTPGLRVLDVGAGVARYRGLFPGHDYKTQDFNADFRPDYIGDICQIPVANSSFDVVLCSEVFEHIPEPGKALEELHRILIVGGILVLTAPLRSRLHQEPFHFYGGFTPHWYRYFMERVGFQVMGITPNGGFFALLGQELQYASHSLRMESPFLWLLSLPILRVIAPAICNFLDPVIRDYSGTVGYHVVARKMK